MRAAEEPGSDRCEPNSDAPSTRHTDLQSVKSSASEPIANSAEVQKVNQVNQISRIAPGPHPTIQRKDENAEPDSPKVRLLDQY